MIAIDTNLLVYAHRAATEEHERARQVLLEAARHPSGWGFALPVVAEFWAVVTHPRASGRPSSPQEAQGFIEALVRGGRAQIWTPNSGFVERLMSTAQSLGTTGVRIFDLQIALISREAGARQLWTHDSGFAAPPGIRALDPLGS
ncbi:MAG: type II toxin-antitoxin system VapC family toxin [Acidobacteriota bacterium]